MRSMRQRLAAVTMIGGLATLGLGLAAGPVSASQPRLIPTRRSPVAPTTSGTPRAAPSTSAARRPPGRSRRAPP